jgi:hypothetical protein
MTQQSNIFFFRVKKKVSLSARGPIDPRARNRGVQILGKKRQCLHLFYYCSTVVYDGV